MNNVNLELNNKSMKLVTTNAGLDKLVIENSFACCQIYLQGAHIVEYTPHAESNILWVSSIAKYGTQQAIRGGIPICWPWFGSHPHDSSMPSHGFARNCVWSLISVTTDEDDKTLVHLKLKSNSVTRKLWPFEFELDYRICIGSQLTVSLTTHNHDQQFFSISEAIHSYFKLQDVASASVLKLSGCYYIDKLAAGITVQQCGDVAIDQAIDRIYLNAPDQQLIVDKLLGRTISVEKSGCADTVIWNPWRYQAQQIKDFDDQGYRQMVCVEAVNSRVNQINIAPNASHTMSQTIKFLPKISNIYAN